MDTLLVYVMDPVFFINNCYKRIIFTRKYTLFFCIKQTNGIMCIEKCNECIKNYEMYKKSGLTLPYIISYSMVASRQTLYEIRDGRPS